MLCTYDNYHGKAEIHILAGLVFRPVVWFGEKCWVLGMLHENMGSSVVWRNFFLFKTCKCCLHLLSDVFLLLDYFFLQYLNGQKFWEDDLFGGNVMSFENVNYQWCTQRYQTQNSCTLLLSISPKVSTVVF